MFEGVWSYSRKHSTNLLDSDHGSIVMLEVQGRCPVDGFVFVNSAAGTVGSKQVVRRDLHAKI